MKIFPTDLRIGLGGAPLAGLFTPISDADATTTVEAAWQEGWRFFDTAPHYGLGLAEERLGAALAGKPRSEYVLSSKVGRIIDEADSEAPDDEGFAVTSKRRRRWDFSRDGVLRSIEDSLRRIGTDRLDIVFVHDPDDHYDEAVATAFPTLIELRDQGVIGAIGSGMNQTAMLTRFVREVDLDVIMLAGRYTLIDPDGLDDVLPACVENDVQVIAVGVFNSGLLARPRPSADATFNYAPADAALIAKANQLADVCDAHGLTLPSAALAFPLFHPAVAGIAVGCRSAAEVHANATLARTQVPTPFWSDLKSTGLLRADAPTPS
ncbi:Pyridoxal 4-dehydrogenase [Kribbella flavida DSM 17836]|uniref:Pyridoxal 4-dehydrogenase n=1 Tax=Kribbella flavida (strain DSM 17836 / JCM 10339 / NBRC 14399) TaxID=479435 RepID=D2Q4T5_KRIFD|nr:aldo/keto reductase [Kribbella flavida]ADB34190.1 Pyridoxal 4-dehydrogenase [Kribbella flavida DSM 17836]